MRATSIARPTPAIGNAISRAQLAGGSSAEPSRLGAERADAIADDHQHERRDDKADNATEQCIERDVDAETAARPERRWRPSDASRRSCCGGCRALPVRPGRPWRRSRRPSGGRAPAASHFSASISLASGASQCALIVDPGGGRDVGDPSSNRSSCVIGAGRPDRRRSWPASAGRAEPACAEPGFEQIRHRPWPRSWRTDRRRHAAQRARARPSPALSRKSGLGCDDLDRIAVADIGVQARRRGAAGQARLPRRARSGTS